MSLHQFKHYLAIGEQPLQLTAEKSTVGFVPIISFLGAGLEPVDEEKSEFRGDKRVLGPTTVIRYSKPWSLAPEMPFFVETGSEKNLNAIIFKHFGGGSASSQNGATGQYYHTTYPVSNPRAAGKLGTKALTLNSNFSHGDTVRNHPHVGGIVKAISLGQAQNADLMWTPEFAGSFIEVDEAEVGSPVFAAENLRMKYNHVKAYSGNITTVGSAPDFTGFTFGSADQFKPKDLNINFSCDREIGTEFCGVDYPTDIIDGEHSVEIDFTVNFNDPASGFDSIDEFTAWLASVSTTQSFAFHWDSGVQAGTGDNYEKFIYLPEMYRMGPEITWDPLKAPVISLKYKGKFNATAQAMWVSLIKNTATSI